MASMNPSIKAVYEAADSEEAMSKAQAALKKAKDAGDKNLEAQANEALMSVHLSNEEYGEADKAASAAVALYKDLKDSEAQSSVWAKLIEAKQYKEGPAACLKIATDALEAFKSAGDVAGQASATLLFAQVYSASAKRIEAKNKAREAQKMYQGVGDKKGEAQALIMIATIDFHEEQGEAITVSEDRVKIFRDLGDQAGEASALILLATAHVARMGKKMGTCAVASAEDTIAALKAAKDAYSLCRSSDAGMVEGAMQAVGEALMMNGVPGDAILGANDPEEVYQDVMSGKYTTPQNALPPPPQPKQLKLEEVVPSSKQLERGKFSWNNPTAQYTYTLVWQSCKEREVKNRKPRGSYDLMFLNTGSKAKALTPAFQARCNDASERNDALVVHMNSIDSNIHIGQFMMDSLNVIASMVVAKLGKVCFVQLNESYVDFTDTRVRNVDTYPSMLGMARSCRIECPNITVGFVGGDIASWTADPAPLIENIFDTIECDESEMMYKRGDAFSPLLVHRPLEEAIQYVKPKRK